MERYADNGNEYYTIPLDEVSTRSAPVLFEWGVLQSLLPENFYSEGVITQDQSGSYVIKLTGEEYQTLVTACRVFMQYVTNDSLFPKLAESISKVSILSGIFADLYDSGNIERMQNFLDQIVNDVMHLIEKIIQAQPDPSSEANLEDAFNAPDADHPLGPHTGYKLDPILETVLEEQMIEGGVPESEVEPSIKDIEKSMDNKLKKSKHVNSMDAFDPNEMIGKRIVLDETPAWEYDEYTNDYGEEITVSGQFHVLEWDWDNNGFIVQANDDQGEIFWVGGDWVVPDEISNFEINELDKQYALPAVEHPLGEHTGNTGNPQDYVQQWIHYDQPITMEHDGSFVDMQGPFFVAKYIEPKRLFALITQDDYENHQQNNVYYVDESQVSLENLAAGEQVDNLQELFEQPSAEHPLGPHTGNMTETEIDQGFRASMERIYRSLLEVGYSANEAQAQVKKLIAEIEQERQTPVEQDVSLNRLTMPSEHLGWYQSDFHEKGNEDLELPNVKEDIVMPDEPTGLEKD